MAPLPVLPACDNRHFDQCLRILTASLPRKGADDLAGDLMLAAYRRKLGHMPAGQISYLTDQALERCKWFPTIAECIQIAAGWERDDEAYHRRNRAAAAVRHEKQNRMEETMAAIRSGAMSDDEINALPERWISIAETRGLLMMREGKYVVRPSVLASMDNPACPPPSPREETRHDRGRAGTRGDREMARQDVISS